MTWNASWNTLSRKIQMKNLWKFKHLKKTIIHKFYYFRIKSINSKLPTTINTTNSKISSMTTKPLEIAMKKSSEN